LKLELARVRGVTEGEALVSEEGFSPRYDLDRETGIISRPGHAIQGESIAGRILFFPTAKGGIAAGWAFYDLVGKNIAPAAIVFGTANPVMVQGAVFAGITIAECPTFAEQVQTGDRVVIEPDNMSLTVHGS